MNHRVKFTGRQMMLIVGLLIMLAFSQSVFAEENDASSTDHHVIGISVYNISDSEVQTFRRYFEQYIGISFDTEFIYSNSISSAQEEEEFIEKLHEQGVRGVISFVSSYAETSVPLCDALGMYYISGSGTLSAEKFDALKKYPTFLGTIGPKAEEEQKAGRWTTEHFIARDREKKENYLIYTGGSGSSFGNEMHRLRSIGILEALDQAYHFQGEKSCAEWVMCEEITRIPTESGNVIMLYPGYSDVVKESLSLYDETRFDYVISAAMFSGLMDVIEQAESNTRANIQIGMVGCFTEDANTWFNTKDAYGYPKLNCLVGKYGATVAPSFVAMMNAYDGHADTFRDHGEAFALYQPFWYASNQEEFNKQYISSEGIAENTYSVVEMLENLVEYNSEADFDQFKAFTER